ncbi:hypothetical protein F2Q69_00005372 [Brassica cretica]|uniref:Uncharacterized protein n=1 Tax=Brassica cretica TaxID=69181 RepID=A0A8S9PCH3_BRACR|nr:hypothetical protein F2Q69_00005372 [Brassica cretica]
MLCYRSPVLYLLDSFLLRARLTTLHLVSRSGGGLAYSFVRHGLKLKPAQALSSAAYYVVLLKISYKVYETIISRNAQDTFYIEARAMLLKLVIWTFQGSKVQINVVF